MDVSNIEALEEYIAYSESMAGTYAKRQKTEIALITSQTSFSTQGHCFVCDEKTSFDVDFLYSDPDSLMDGKRIPNWRERVTCPGCKLNSRTRGSIQFLEQNLNANPIDDVYITEQITPLYSYLQKKYSKLCGSEYLGRDVPYGEIDPGTGVRNESVTKLTFANDSFDFILSFDVFEHVPEYISAFAECLRCLKPRGTLLFSVPFNTFAENNLTRAKIDQNGNVEHLLEPEYHGDPINDKGCLCFYHFGWEMLEQMRELGFTKVQAHLFWSEELAYLGNEQILFSARAPRRSIWDHLRHYLRDTILPKFSPN